MSYLALARKWRPRIFSQLVGQEHINKALTNALNQQRLHHAYLFTGTRGVGKTSIARILAKSFNCEEGISSEPCLRCSACTAIEQARFIDLIEIDGASKTRIEDTRELLDNVPYAPTQGRFKIYLIDEVHMLSQHSFNALLKTLEEPPAHVKFILATTDPQKVPVTVLSRCLQFNLKHLTAETITSHLQMILQEEQLDFEMAAVSLIAQAARGSMRDALSLLDQAITSCTNKLLSSDVKLLLGYTQQNYALMLLQALARRNASSLIEISQQIAMEGGQFHYVLDELLHYFHHIALHQILEEQTSTVDSDLTEIIPLISEFSDEDIQLFYQIALRGREEIHLAPTLLMGFNMTLLRMFTFRPAPPPKDLLIENNLSSVMQPTENKQAACPADNLINFTEEASGNPASEIEERLETLPQDEKTNPSWLEIISQLKLSGLALNAIENTELLNRNERDLTLGVNKGHISLFTPTILTRLEAALGKYYQRSIKIILNCDQQINASPAQQKEHLIHQKQNEAELALRNDPMLQQLEQEFSAQWVKNSIVPLKDDL